MKPKTMSRILIAISILLALSLVACCIKKYFDSTFDLIPYVSGLTGIMIAILTILNVSAITKQMEIMNSQLEETTFNRELSNQPVIIPNNLEFKIERPRFFYSPPGDEYDFLSRYYLFADIVNASEYPAIYLSCTAELIVGSKIESQVLKSNARRINVLTNSTKDNKARIMFTGDNDSKLLSALREAATDKKPRVSMNILYKSISGGCYRISSTYILDIPEGKEDVIKLWNTNIVSAPIETKEVVQHIREIKDDAARRIAFTKQRDTFDMKQGDDIEISIRPIELIDKYIIEKITDEEYSKTSQDHRYNRYVSARDKSCFSTKKVK